MLPGVLPLFRRKQPNTRVELVSLITTEQEDKIRSGELDIGLMRHPIYSPEIDYLELLHEPLVVVLPVDHPLAKAEKVSASQLDGVDFVSTDPAYSGALAPIVRAWFEQQKASRVLSGGDQYSGDHESGGDGARGDFDTRLYESF